MKKVVRIAVTGAAGQIGYSLLFRLASGEVFGKDTPIALHLLEREDVLGALEGVKMELDDSAFPLLTEVVQGFDPHKVFEGVDYAFLVGAKPRGKGMERKDLLMDNALIFVEQGRALNRSDVKVLVVGNPANTNALVLKHNAPNLPSENIRAMMRLDHNRAKAQIANRAMASVKDIKKMVVWGNHSATQVPDYNFATINGKSVSTILEKDWLQGEFIETVQKRGAAIIQARGLSSAASAANAAIDSIKDWVNDTEKGDYYSSAVFSDGNPYGVSEGLYFSFPMTHKGIVSGLEIDVFMEEKIKLTEKELLEEREAVSKFLS